LPSARVFSPEAAAREGGQPLGLFDGPQMGVFNRL